MKFDLFKSYSNPRIPCAEARRTRQAGDRGAEPAVRPHQIDGQGVVHGVALALAHLLIVGAVDLGRLGQTQP